LSVYLSVNGGVDRRMYAISGLISQATPDVRPGAQTEVEVILVEAGNTLAHPGAMTGSQSFTEHYYHC
jgi:hypothetical protein